MKTIKNVFYYGSVVLPIINNIYKLCKFIVDFNNGNSEVLAARKEIVDNVKYLQQVVGEINNFHHLNDD